MNIQDLTNADLTSDALAEKYWFLILLYFLRFIP